MFGVTFSSQWSELSRDKSNQMEDDYGFFRKCKLTQVALYLSDKADAESLKVMKKAKFKLHELYLSINCGKIHYKTNRAEVKFDLIGARKSGE